MTKYLKKSNKTSQSNEQLSITLLEGTKREVNDRNLIVTGKYGVVHYKNGMPTHAAWTSSKKDGKPIRNALKSRMSNLVKGSWALWEVPRTLVGTGYHVSSVKKRDTEGDFELTLHVGYCHPVVKVRHGLNDVKRLERGTVRVLLGKCLDTVSSQASMLTKLTKKDNYKNKGVHLLHRERVTKTKR